MGCVAISDPKRFSTAADLPPEEVIFGSSPVMMEIRRNVERGADFCIPLLLQGETGTGKEVLARFIHRCSRWASGPFVKVNCPAVPAALFESELFGYERGAFTGAYGSKPGRVELARGGTLFLDEVGDLDLNLQAKLLQLLQDGVFCRIGDSTEKHVEARIVCATNRPLRHAIRNGSFRRDLFYRISVFSMHLPRLEERKGDIPMLVGYFFEKYGSKYGRVVPPFSNSLLRRLQEYSWPGNIRQLENLVHRYAVFESEQDIRNSLEAEDGRDSPVRPPPSCFIGLKELTQEAVRRFQSRIILQTLEANGWHRGRAARDLGISYGALLYKIKEAGFPLKEQRKLMMDDSTVPDPGEEWSEEAELQDDHRRAPLRSA
jgi:two-component system, NtrC family, response regulator AtoC